MGGVTATCATMGDHGIFGRPLVSPFSSGDASVTRLYAAPADAATGSALCSATMEDQADDSYEQFVESGFGGGGATRHLAGASSAAAEHRMFSGS